MLHRHTYSMGKTVKREVTEETLEGTFTVPLYTREMVQGACTRDHQMRRKDLV